MQNTNIMDFCEQLYLLSNASHFPVLCLGIKFSDTPTYFRTEFILLNPTSNFHPYPVNAAQVTECYVEWRKNSLSCADVSVTGIKLHAHRGRFSDLSRAYCNLRRLMSRLCPLHNVLSAADIQYLSNSDELFRTSLLRD